MDDLSDLMQNLSDLNLETKCDLYRPDKLLNSLDLDGVTSFMKSDKCKSIKSENIPSFYCYALSSIVYFYYKNDIFKNSHSIILFIDT